MTETEYAEWLANEEAEDPEFCGELFHWDDEGGPEYDDVEMMEWCQKPWGHESPNFGDGSSHEARKLDGRVIVSWADPYWHAILRFPK